MTTSVVRLALSGLVLGLLLSGCCCGGGTDKETTIVKEPSIVKEPTSSVTKGQELQDLKAAHDQGALTDEEFQKEKEKLLKAD